MNDTPSNDTPSNDPPSNDPPSNDTKAARIAAFLAANGREKRELFKGLRPELTAEDLPQIAVGVRDSSPKLSARITSLLARHGREDLLEQHLAGLKPGKIELLRQQYRRIAAKQAAPTESSDETNK